MVDVMTQTVFVIGRNKNNSIDMLGTGFAINNGKYIVTPRHVVSDNDENLVMILPSINSFNQYQDTTNNSCSVANLKLKHCDPFRDIAILEVIDRVIISCPMVPLGSFDDVSVGDEIYIFGFPHCVEGRKVLTFQKAYIGAKILLDCSGIKSKYSIINTLSRPGQSGSLIYSKEKNSIIGMLIGAFSPNSGISLGGINPRELHQTTQCISAEYIKNMIGE